MVANMVASRVVKLTACQQRLARLRVGLCLFLGHLNEDGESRASATGSNQLAWPAVVDLSHVEFADREHR